MTNGRNGVSMTSGQGLPPKAAMLAALKGASRKEGAEVDAPRFVVRRSHETGGFLKEPVCSSHDGAASVS